MFNYITLYIWQLQKWFVPPPEEGDNGPEQGLWQGDQGEGKQGKEVWGLSLCKVPSGMVHMRECFHCPPPELFVEFVDKLSESDYRSSHCPPTGACRFIWACSLALPNEQNSSGSKRGEGC